MPLDGFHGLHISESMVSISYICFALVNYIKGQEKSTQRSDC
jgi:hypothetical protein